jgi:hypothetical protein
MNLDRGTRALARAPNQRSIFSLRVKGRPLGCRFFRRPRALTIFIEATEEWGSGAAHQIHGRRLAGE